jgi:hypothetical protein
MKYIVYKKYEDTTIETLFIFPETENHSDVFAQVKTYAGTIISAGFVYKDGNGELYCTGKSYTCDVSSRGEVDTKLLNSMLERM